MGFRNGAWATVWEVKNGAGNYTDVRLSTSKKNKQTDQYETDFSGFVRLVGEAHTNAAALHEKSRIKIGDCDVTNRYSKEKQETYTNFVVFSFENMTENGQNTQKNDQKPESNASFMDIPNGLDSELPFN